MLRGESILCFAPDPWDDIWRNRHQIMSLLAEGNRVLYVEPRPYLRPLMQRAMRGEVSLAELRAPRLREVRSGLYVFRPPLYAPLIGREPLAGLSKALRVASLRRAMRRLRMSRPILWLFRPEMADIPGDYGEKLLIYHIVDEYTGYGGLESARAEAMRRRERELIARADLVLVTSKALLESKGGINPNTHWVPNGVDYERFASAAARRLEPVEMAGLPRPRIGYVGAINDKINAGLLLHVAEAYPQATLVMVGPVRAVDEETRAGLEALRSRPNVRFVGQVPGERVPEFVAACDVGLLPYRQNVWTQHIQPLKLYEYLACGLPVVSTEIPAVREEGEVVFVARDAQAFVRLVGQALATDNAALRAARQERAARNTWRERVEHISALIEASLGCAGDQRSGSGLPRL